MKTLQTLLQEVLFADVWALSAHADTDLQLMLDRFSDASKLFGLTVNIGKTEVLHQPAPKTNPQAPNIVIDDTQLGNVEHFKYLRSVISSDGSLDREISARISKASQALGCLRTRVMTHKSNKLDTKIKVYKAVILTSLLYGFETWTLYCKHTKQLERFHTRSLRVIMGMKWKDRVTNLKVLDRAGLLSIEAMILKAQLRWSGPVIRMEPHRLPRKLLYGESYESLCIVFP